MRRLIRLIRDNLFGREPEPVSEHESFLERLKREDPAFHEWLMKRKEAIERKRHAR